MTILKAYYYTEDVTSHECVQITAWICLLIFLFSAVAIAIFANDIIDINHELYIAIAILIVAAIGSLMVSTFVKGDYILLHARVEDSYDITTKTANDDNIDVIGKMNSSDEYLISYYCSQLTKEIFLNTNYPIDIPIDKIYHIDEIIKKEVDE